MSYTRYKCTECGFIFVADGSDESDSSLCEECRGDQPEAAMPSREDVMPPNSQDPRNIEYWLEREG